MAMKGKMEITLGVAIGSSIQIAVGVVPIMVLVSWAIGRELTLYFENFETICFFIAILLVNVVVGKFDEILIIQAKSWNRHQC
jgi:Ca2+:H+ antiporter